MYVRTDSAHPVKTFPFLNCISYSDSKNAHFPGHPILSKDLVFIMLFTLIDIYEE